MANMNSEPTSAVVTFPVASPQSGIQPEPSSNGQGEPKPPSMQALTDEAKQEKVGIYYSIRENPQLCSCPYELFGLHSPRLHLCSTA